MSECYTFFGSATEKVLVQPGARRRSIAGTYGNGGTLESVTYRIQRVLVGSNPTLSDSHTSNATAPAAYLPERTLAEKPDRESRSPARRPSMSGSSRPDKGLDAHGRPEGRSARRGGISARAQSERSDAAILNVTGVERPQAVGVARPARPRRTRHRNRCRRPNRWALPR
jgi:hypothetical protein